MIVPSELVPWFMFAVPGDLCAATSLPRLLHLQMNQLSRDNYPLQEGSASQFRLPQRHLKDL